jgi:tight adherence protein B
MPITEAIAMTSREYTGPIGQEMTKVYEDQKVGDTLPEAVQKMTFRVPLAEVKMFSTAVTIQTQTGSSLSEVLQNLSGVIRQRFRLKRKVQALSAEAKISAGIIGCLPVVVIGSMYLLNREYIELLWITNTGKMLTYGALTWMSIGVFIMKGMINFRV